MAFDVRDFHNGSAPDYTAAVIAALAAASGAGGGTVLFPGGTYELATQILLPSGVRLQGEGPSTTLKLKNGSATGLPSGEWLWANSVSDVGVCDMTIDGNGVNQATLFDCLRFSSVTRGDVRGVRFINAYGTAWSNGLSTDVSGSDLLFQEIRGGAGNPGEGMYFIGCQRVIVDHVTGVNLDDHLVYADGSAANQGADFLFSNMLAVNAGRQTGSSAYNTTQNTRRVRWHGCHAYSCGIGFTVNSNPGLAPQDVEFRDCSARVTTASGNAPGFSVALQSGTDGKIRFHDCVAEQCGNGVAGTVGHGFVLIAGGDVTLVGCEARNNNDDGLRIGASPRTYVIGGAYISNSKRASAAFCGIRVGDGSGTMGTNACNGSVIVGARCTDTAPSGKAQSYGIIVEQNAGTVSLAGNLLDGNLTGYESVAGSGVILIDDDREVPSGDRGTGTITLTWGTDAPIQRFASLISGPGTSVVLPVGAQVPIGAKYRVARTGGGAGSLPIGGLITLPAPTSAVAWADVVYDGTAWRLVAAGNI